MRELFGRDHELADLRARLETAVAGHGGLVLVSGEPGIGKTALLDHLADEARLLGAAIAWGTCWNDDGAPGLWPWQRIVSSIGAPAELAELRRDASGDFGLFARVSDLIREYAARQPLLVVVDDLQWADDGCLRLLKFLARDLHTAPVLFAGAMRTSATNPARELMAIGLHQPLVGLEPTAVADLLGAAGSDRTAATRVAERTAGNPFFVREIARILDSGGSRLPVAVDDAVATRVGALPDETADAIRLAATIGRRFEDDLLGLALGSDDVSGMLAPAKVDHLVEHDLAGAHRFVHDLVREHLQALPEPTLHALHHRVALAIEDLPELPMRAGRLAVHLVQSGPRADPAYVVRCCEDAARDAAARHAYDEAARHLKAALDLDPSPDTSARELELASALLRAGRLGDARVLFTRLAEAADSPEVLARAALGTHEVGQLSSESRRGLIDHLERARQALGGGSLKALVTAALARETADGPDRDPARASALATEALTLARELGDQSVLAACLFARHDVVWGPGTAEERRDLAGELMHAAHGVASDLVFQGALCGYVALLELADGEARTALLGLEALAADLGQPVLSYLARSRADAWAVMVGADDAEARVRDSYEAGLTLEVPDAFGVLATQLITLDITRGEPARLLERQRELGGRLMPSDFHIEERAFELFAAGDLGGATEELTNAPRPSERTHYRWRALAGTAFGLEIGWRCGARVYCDAAYNDLLANAGELIVIGGGVSAVGPVDLYLGLAAIAGTHPERARPHLEAALVQARRLGAEPWIARLAGLLAAGGRPVLRRDGAVWLLEYAGISAHLPDNKGLRDLAALLDQPGKPVSALTLVGTTGAELGSDPVIDDAARAAYGTRLRELDALIETAREEGHAQRLLEAEDERDALIAELRHATGLGGRSRRLGDAGERARSTVTARIRDALRRIDVVHPELGAHLRGSVRTGRSCVYQPDPPHSV